MKKNISIPIAIVSLLILLGTSCYTDKYSISGTVLNNNTGLGNVSIVIFDSSGNTRQVSTDSNGVYSINDLSSGTYTVRPSKTGYTFNPEKKESAISTDNITGVNFSASAQTSSNPDEIKIICVGDINYGHFMEEAIVDTARGNGDYTYPFHFVAETLRKADITFGNLESIISDQGTNSKELLSALGYGLSLRGNPKAVEGLVYAGFDIINLANNHIGDYDYEAMVDCFSRLKNAGIDYLGAGNNYAEAHSPVIKEINGTKIAFLGYSNVPMYADITLTSPTRKWVAGGSEIGIEEHAGLAWAHNTRFELYGDFIMMQDDIQSARQQADIVIVSAHFGWEYDLKPDMPPHDTAMDQQMLAHMAIDAGASLVVGHHPHVVQWLDDANTTALENYNGGYIAYSLGNFAFDISSTHPSAPNGEATHGIMLEITIKNGAIAKIDQVKTYYLDDLWQAHIE